MLMQQYCILFLLFQPAAIPAWFVSGGHEKMQSRGRKKSPCKVGYFSLQSDIYGIFATSNESFQLLDIHNIGLILDISQVSERRSGWQRPAYHSRGLLGGTGGDKGTKRVLPPSVGDTSARESLSQHAQEWTTPSDEVLLSQPDTLQENILSERANDGSPKLRNDGEVSQNKSFSSLHDDSRRSLNSSMLLSDKIELSINQPDSDDDESLGADRFDEGTLDYGDESAWLDEALEMELAGVEGKNSCLSDDIIGEENENEDEILIVGDIENQDIDNEISFGCEDRLLDGTVELDEYNNSQN